MHVYITSSYYIYRKKILAIFLACLIWFFKTIFWFLKTFLCKGLSRISITKQRKEEKKKYQVNLCSNKAINGSSKYIEVLWNVSNLLLSVIFQCQKYSTVWNIKVFLNWFKYNYFYWINWMRIGKRTTVPLYLYTIFIY